MPAKTAQVTIESKPVVEQVRHVIRRIGQFTNEAAGVMSSPDFELYLKEAYFDDGWDIQHVQVLDQDAGNINMLYVLVKRVAQ